MKLFYYGKDGGPESHVWGFWLIEAKSLFSIVLLRFENGTREAYHSHAFNSLSWVLRGRACVRACSWSCSLARSCRYSPTRRPSCSRC
mgnify:CR=1 FL=1